MSLTKVTVPLVDRTIDLTSADGAFDAGGVVLSFVFLFIAVAIGRNGAERAMNAFQELVGISLDGGNNGGDLY